MTFVPGPEDNGSQLRCEAFNDAVSKPVFNTITIELLPESTTVSSTTSTATVSDTEYYSEEEEKEEEHYEEDIHQAANENEVDRDTEDEYNYDYNDEDYFYQYPDDVVPSNDPSFMHPELTQSAIFLGKIDLTTDKVQDVPMRVENEEFKHSFVHKADKNNLEIDVAKWKKNHILDKVHENEVYPKDAPYIASSCCMATSSFSFIFLLSLCLLWAKY